MRADVYYNLHKHCLSVKDLKTGKVAMHTPAIMLRNATFVVSAKGRERVLKTKQKNVHAFVRGEVWFTQTSKEAGPYAEWLSKPYRGFRLATYNPYKYTSFVDVETEQPLTGEYIVFVFGKKVYYKEQ